MFLFPCLAMLLEQEPIKLLAGNRPHRRAGAVEILAVVANQGRIPLNLDFYHVLAFLFKKVHVDDEDDFRQGT